MKVVSTSNAPAAIGPYSQAIDLGNMVFVSGQIPVDPATGKMADTVEEQAAQSLANLKAISEIPDKKRAAGCCKAAFLRLFCGMSEGAGGHFCTPASHCSINCFATRGLRPPARMAKASAFTSS